MAPATSYRFHPPFHTLLGPPNTPEFSKSHDSHMFLAASVSNFSAHFHFQRLPFVRSLITITPIRSLIHHWRLIFPPTGTSLNFPQWLFGLKLGIDSPFDPPSSSFSLSPVSHSYSFTHSLITSGVLSCFQHPTGTSLIFLQLITVLFGLTIGTDSPFDPPSSSFSLSLSVNSPHSLITGGVLSCFRRYRRTGTSLAFLQLIIVFFSLKISLSIPFHHGSTTQQAPCRPVCY